MFLGHGLLAFAIAATVARLAGASPERALSVGLLAGAFGMAPDIDILYAPVGILGHASVLGAAEGFWAAGNQIHRTVTHSLVVGAIAALAAGLWARADWTSRTAAVGCSCTLVVVAVGDGLLAAAIMGAFVGVILAIAGVGARRHRPAIIAATALMGLGTHPFGDMLTGQPPAFFYPVEVGVLGDRFVLNADPTLHLLGALGLELATAWLALCVLLWLKGWDLQEILSPRASLGVGYGAAAVLLPPPTLDTSYHFVFPLLSLGVISAVGPRAWTEWRTWALRPGGWLQPAVTALTTVTLAAVAYSVAYLWL